MYIAKLAYLLSCLFFLSLSHSLPSWVCVCVCAWVLRVTTASISTNDDDVNAMWWRRGQCNELDDFVVYTRTRLFTALRHNAMTWRFAHEIRRRLSPYFCCFIFRLLLCVCGVIKMPVRLHDGVAANTRRDSDQRWFRGGDDHADLLWRRSTLRWWRCCFRD
jgi:hypothetical protein